jgi:hypothetical protein
MQIEVCAGNLRSERCEGSTGCCHAFEKSRLDDPAAEDSIARNFGGSEVLREHNGISSCPHSGLHGEENDRR